MTALLNWRVWAALALAAGLAFSHFTVYKTGKAAVRADFDAFRIAQAQAAQKAEAVARTEETRREAEKQEVIDHARQEIAAAQVAADAADAAAASLRGQLTAYVAAVRRATANPGAPSRSTPAGDPIGVLADVLGRADERAGILAKFADSAHIAGTACERYADGLQPR